MKKLGLAALGITAAIVALVNLGSLLALAFSALVAYAGFHYFRKSNFHNLKIILGRRTCRWLVNSNCKCTGIHRNHCFIGCSICLA